MAKNTAPMGPLIGALFDSVTPPERAKTSNRKPKTSATTLGEKSMAEPNQQHGELAAARDPKPMSDRALEKDHARSEKRRATADWVSGHISTKQHTAVHKRANHVLTGKSPREFKGTTGEKAAGKMKIGRW
jgi:hypothetical protein